MPYSLFHRRSPWPSPPSSPASTPPPSSRPLDAPSSTSTSNSNGFTLAPTSPVPSTSEKDGQSIGSVKSSSSFLRRKSVSSVSKLKSLFRPAPHTPHFDISVETEQHSDHGSPLSTSLHLPPHPSRLAARESSRRLAEYAFDAPPPHELPSSSPFLPMPSSSLSFEILPGAMGRGRPTLPRSAKSPVIPRVRRTDLYRTLATQPAVEQHFPKRNSFQSSASDSSLSPNRLGASSGPHPHPYLHLPTAPPPSESDFSSPASLTTRYPHPRRHVSSPIPPSLHQQRYIPSPDPHLTSAFSDYSSPENPSDAVGTPAVSHAELSPPVVTVALHPTTWSTALPGYEGDCEPLLSRLGRRNVLRKESSAPSLLDHLFKAFGRAMTPTFTALPKLKVERSGYFSSTPRLSPDTKVLSPFPSTSLIPANSSPSTSSSPRIVVRLSRRLASADVEEAMETGTVL